MIRLAVLGIAGAIAYQSFDAFRSALTATQPKASAPEADPTKSSVRIGALIFGLMTGLIGLTAASWAFGLWGEFSR